MTVSVFAVDPDVSPLPPFDGHPPSPRRTRADAMARFEHDEGLYARLTPLFAQAATDQAAALLEAIGEGDAGRSAYWAHTLKGSLLTVGALRPAVRAERIELAVRDGRLADLMPRALQLAAETAILAAQLTQPPSASRD